MLYIVTEESNPPTLAPPTPGNYGWTRRALRVLAVLAACWAMHPGLFARAQDTAPSAAAAQDGADGAHAASTGRSLLDSITSSSIYGLIVVLLIFLLSIAAVGLIFEHAITIRRGKLIPDDALADLEEMIALGQFDQAIEYCSEPDNDSLAADVILAGLQRYRSSEFGFAEYKSAVEEAGEDYTARLYRKTDVLGVIGAIAPMLGLTGTVLGMIEAFNTIAAKGGMARPDELAGGIGTALVTTLLGLVVAIPSMVAFAYFRNRIDSLVSEAGKRVEHVLMPLSRKR